MATHATPNMSGDNSDAENDYSDYEHDDLVLVGRDCGSKRLQGKNHTLYEPEFTSKRLTGKNTSHTMRRNTHGESDINPSIRIERPSDADGLIPITPVDDLIDFIDFKTVERVLNKRDLYNTVRDAIEKYATSIRHEYDRRDNHDIMIATVPITSYVNPPKEIKSTFQHAIVQHHDVDDVDDDKPREKFITIGGQRYSCSKCYNKDFRVMNIPDEAFKDNTTVDDGKQIYRVSKIMFNKQNITITFDKETRISSLILRPERMKFELKHTDAFRCKSDCKKLKHCISILKNDPGYITRFEMQYRSDDTLGKWMKVGVFSGNQSMYDITQINFDEINVKQFRIIPISHVNSFTKIRLYPVGKMIIKPITDDSFVTYTLLMPRDGKYLKKYDFTHDSMHKFTYKCDCHRCLGVKGWNKDKTRCFSDACDVDY